MDDHPKMWQWFHVELNDVILFETWKIGDFYSCILSCLAVGALGFLLEFLKFSRNLAHYRFFMKHEEKMSRSTKYGGILVPGNRKNRLFWKNHLTQTIYHFWCTLLTFLLMNIFMTFNIFICLSLCLGLTIGYFTFVIDNKHICALFLLFLLHTIMLMWFHTQVQETVLFETWKVTDAFTMLWTCAIVVVAGVFLESIKFLRWKIEKRIRIEERIVEKPFTSRLFAPKHVLQTLLFLVQLTFSYILMLLFMTFSVWLGIAVVAGLSVGFLAFGARIQ